MNYIRFRHTGLESTDIFIRDAQKIVNTMHKIRLELIEGAKKLVSSTEVNLIKDANTSHAIIGLVYAIYAQTQGAATKKLFSTKPKFPYLVFGKDSAPINISKDMLVITKYMYSLEKATKEVPKLVDQCLELAKASVNLVKNAKSELEKKDPVIQTNAMRALTKNGPYLKRTYNVAKVLMGLVKRIGVEVKHSYDVLNEKKEDLIDMGKQLADEAITKPIDCYKKFHDTKDSDLAVDVGFGWLDAYEGPEELPESKGEVNKENDDDVQEPAADVAEKPEMVKSDEPEKADDKIDENGGQADGSELPEGDTPKRVRKDSAAKNDEDSD